MTTKPLFGGNRAAPFGAANSAMTNNASTMLAKVASPAKGKPKTKGKKGTEVHSPSENKGRVWKDHRGWNFAIGSKHGFGFKTPEQAKVKMRQAHATNKIATATG